VQRETVKHSAANRRLGLLDKRDATQKGRIAAALFKIRD
jgi:hypothetical protein